MSAVINDRFTTQIDQPFVVFLVGGRVNRLLAFNKWKLIATAFPEMLNFLQSHPETGFLGGEQFFRLFPITTILVSYWRSFPDLERFAPSKDQPHLEARQRFKREGGYNGDVGVGHEKDAGEPGRYEALYRKIPLFGLSK